MKTFDNPISVMSIDNYLGKMKQIQNHIQNFIENSDNEEENYNLLTILFNDLKIVQNYHELKSVLYLLNQISKNHNRTFNFIRKIEQIILFLQDHIKQSFSNTEIFQIFKRNKYLLLFLIENKILTVDNNIFIKMKTDEKCVNGDYLMYFYPEIKSFLSKELIEEYSSKICEQFDEKRRKGENDSYICELIRNDSVKEFISYVNKTNFPLSGSIPPSIFETNPLLIKNKETTLIEYAAFFGSIQIARYLRLNKVQLEPNLWIYVIHGRNPELIHFLEDDHIEAPNNNDFQKCLRESIKCYHNEIKEYIQNNFLNDTNEKSYEFYSNIFDFYDFASIQSSYIDQSSFYFLCKNDYYILVDILLKSNAIDVNSLYDLKNIFKHKALNDVLI